MDDITFSWIDSEITFDGAVKMQGCLVLDFKLINSGITKYRIINPMFKTSPNEPHNNGQPINEKISIDDLEEISTESIWVSLAGEHI